MSNEILKFDPATLMQGVRDRIKATFVSLIPDEQWDQLCQTQMEEFFRKKESYNNNREYKSDFDYLCREVLREIAKTKIEIALAEYDSTVWKDNQVLINDKLKEMLIGSASEILLSMIGGQVQSVIQNMKSRGY